MRISTLGGPPRSSRHRPGAVEKGTPVARSRGDRGTFLREQRLFAKIKSSPSLSHPQPQPHPRRLGYTRLHSARRDISTRLARWDDARLHLQVLQAGVRSRMRQGGTWAFADGFTARHVEACRIVPTIHRPDQSAISLIDETPHRDRPANCGTAGGVYENIYCSA